MRLLWRMGDWSRRLLLLLLLRRLLLRQWMMLRELWGNLLGRGHVVRHGGNYIGAGEQMKGAAAAAEQLRIEAVVEVSTEHAENQDECAEAGAASVMDRAILVKATDNVDVAARYRRVVRVVSAGGDSNLPKPKLDAVTVALPGGLQHAAEGAVASTTVTSL